MTTEDKQQVLRFSSPKSLKQKIFLVNKIILMEFYNFYLCHKIKQICSKAFKTSFQSLIVGQFHIDPSSEVLFRIKTKTILYHLVSFFSCHQIPQFIYFIQSKMNQSADGKSKTSSKGAQIQEQESLNIQKESTSFRRKKADNQTLEVKRTQTSRTNRPSDRSFDQVSVSSHNKSQVGGAEEENEKMMVLSNEAREALISMQRFDRFIYIAESEKKLKVPIENQLKRLEKIKNSGNKLMKNTFFDNQITITCLYNHMKNLYQLSKELGQIVVLKEQIEVLQQKIVEMNVKFNKDLKEASNMAKGKAAQDQQTLKDTLKFIDTLIFAMKEKNVEKGRKKIEVDLKRATDSRKQLMQLVHNLLGRVGGGAASQGVVVEDGGNDIYQTYIQKLIKDQGSSEKNITYLQSQLTVIQKLIKDSKAPDIKNIYTDLKQTATYLTSLNTTIKDNQSLLLNAQKKNVANQGPSESEKQKLKQLQQLESIINGFEQDGEVWHKQLELINIKVQKNQNFVGDLNKNKKLLTGKKQINQTVSKLVSSYLTLLQLSSSKSQDSQSTKQLQDKYNQLLSTNQTLEKELAKLKKQADSSNPKGQAEITKFINMLQQSLTLKEGESVIPLTELQKIKKYIDLNRKKIPEDFHNTLNNIQTLIKSLIENEDYIKSKQLENQKNQQSQNKDISNLDAILKTLQKLINSNDPINDAFVNKLKRNIEQSNSKIDKLADSPLNNLFRSSNANIVKLVELFSDAYRNSKSKGDAESESKHQIEQLRSQVKNKQTQITKNSKIISQYESSIKALNKQIEQHYNKEAQLQNSSAQLNKKIGALQKQIAELQKKRVDGDKKIEEYKQSMKKLKDSRESTLNQDQKKDETINQLYDKIAELQRIQQDRQAQIDRLNQNVEELNRDLTITKEQLGLNNIEISNRDKQIERIQRQLNTQINNFEGLINERQSLAGENRNLQNQIRQLQIKIQTVNTDLTGDKNELHIIKTENDSLKRQLQGLRNNQNQLLQQSTKLKRQDDAQSRLKDQQFDNLKRLYENLKNNFDQQKSGWTNDSKTLNQIRNQKQLLIRETESLRIHISNVESQNRSLTQKINDLERLLQNQQQNSSQASGFQNKIRDLQSRLVQARNANNDLQMIQNSKISSLQNQNRMFQSQLRQRNNEVSQLRASSNIIKAPVSYSSSQYDAHRYLVLKQENVMLKEQIIARDQVIKELEEQSDENNPKISSIKNFSSQSKDKETIRRLQGEINELRFKVNDSSSQQRYINQNRELTQGIRIREMNLQNAIGDNEHLFREVNRYKQIQSDLRREIGSLNTELSILRTNVNNQIGGESVALKQNINNLIQQKSRLQGSLRTYERDLQQSQIQINTANNQVQILKQKIKLSEDTEQSQKRSIEDLRNQLNSMRSNEKTDTNIIIERLQTTIREISVPQNNQASQLRTQNNELKDRLRQIETSSRVRTQYDHNHLSQRKVDDRVSELTREKAQYIKTIKSMQSLLHSKDIKLIQLYNQRESDLHNLIQQNKMLQEEINRINERLVKDKIKTLISPKMLQDSLNKMENQLVELQKQNFMLKEQIQTLEQQLEKQRHLPHSEIKSSSSIGLDKNTNERVRLLESQRIKLSERIQILSVYQKINNQNQPLIANINKLIDAVFVFLSESDDFADCDFDNNEFLTAINECLSTQNYEHYFDNIEDLFKDLFLRVVARKNEILEKQAHQLLLLRQKMQEILLQQESVYFQDDSYSRSYYQRPQRRYDDTEAKKKASLIALQHLFKLYLKAKDPAVLKEISQLLSISQGRGRYYQ